MCTLIVKFMTGDYYFNYYEDFEDALFAYNEYSENNHVEYVKMVNNLGDVILANTTHFEFDY